MISTTTGRQIVCSSVSMILTTLLYTENDTLVDSAGHDNTRSPILTLLSAMWHICLVFVGAVPVVL